MGKIIYLSSVYKKYGMKGIDMSLFEHLNMTIFAAYFKMFLKINEDLIYYHLSDVCKFCILQCSLIVLAYPKINILGYRL